LTLITRRKFLALTAVGAAAVAGDGFLFEPNRPRLVRKNFFLPRWPKLMNGFTIALLSDFHYDPFFSIHPLHAAIPIVNSLHPDLIVLTGDFVTCPDFGDVRKAATAADPCAHLLRQMNAPFGLWAVLGNHDVDTDPQYVTRALESENIHVLSNQAQPIERSVARIWLVGMPDIFTRTADVPGTLRDIPPDEAVILLAHEPDFADVVAKYPVDLQLSGHSHGGQIRIPFLPPLFLPELAKKYFLGTYRVGPLTLYTNAGLGTVEVPARLNCPPEITFLTLNSPNS
jgi:uncharacterized protein